MTCTKCQHATVKKFGRYGRQRVQRAPIGGERRATGAERCQVEKNLQRFGAQRQEER